MTISTETRLAVLEKIADSHDKRISDVEDFQHNIVDRLDQKINLDVQSQLRLENTLSKTTATLDALNETVVKVVDRAEKAQQLAEKHEIIGTTILKIGAILSTVFGAIWVAAQVLMKYVGQLHG